MYDEEIRPAREAAVSAVKPGIRNIAMYPEYVKTPRNRYVWTNTARQRAPIAASFSIFFRFLETIYGDLKFVENLWLTE